MANSCDFEMKVKGKGENVRELIKLIEDNALDVSEERCFGGWIDNIMFDIEYNPSEKTCIGIITGECKWSVLLSLLGAEGSYFDKMKNDGDESNVTCLEIESQRLGVEIEIYSSEYGVGFEEHFLIRNGVLEINECIKAWKLYKYYFEDEDASDEFKEIVEEFYENKISNSEWKRKHKELMENPRNYRLGGYDEWKFEI